jgi:hypothetical protein
MCTNCDCYTPNKPATLTLADQASLWADIKAARIALQARQSFLEALGMDLATQAADSKLIALEGLTAALWTRFRVL